MSFLSKLGTLLEIGGLAAAPFTGGASTALTGIGKGAKIASAASKIAPIVGKVAQTAASGRAGARVAEAGLNADEDRLALDRAEQAQRARATDEASAVRGGLLEGITDAEITRPDGVVDHVSGGLRPSAIAGHAAMGKKFKEDALARIVADNSTPQLTQTPKAGTLDRILNFASGASGLIGIGGQLKGAMASPIPDVTAHVNSDPTSIIGATPNVTDAFDPSLLPPRPTYNPKFTKRPMSYGR